MMGKNLAIAFILASFLLLIAAVDRSKFRTCQDTRFCREYRQHASPATENQWVRVGFHLFTLLN